MTEPTITVPAPPTTEQILHLIRDYQRHHLHQAIQHTGAMQQMFFNKATAARDIERTLVTLMGADHD
jgi:hypothetical protein